MCICAYVSVSVSVHMYLHVCACELVCTYVSTCVCVWACLYICIYMCVRVSMSVYTCELKMFSYIDISTVNISALKNEVIPQSTPPEAKDSATNYTQTLLQ